MKAGTLEIELVAQIAKLQQDMERVKKSVGDMTTDVGRKAKAVNDNLSSIGRGAGAGMREVAREAGRLQGQLGHVTSSAGAQRAGMQQLGMQLGDMATMYALGARPAQIFASQMGQVTQAIMLMGGQGSKFARFLGGPWGIGISVATVALIPFIGKLFESKDALADVKFASDAMGDAQGILGNVLDLTTGKINTQNQALLALAQAQILVGKVQAQSRAVQARRDVQAIQSRPLEFQGGGLGGGFMIGRRPVDARDTISRQFLDGTLSGKTAVERLDNLRNAGRLTDEQFMKAAAAVASLGVELENIKAFEEADRLLNGKGGTSLLKPDKGNRSWTRRKEIDEDAKALERAIEASKDYLSALEGETTRIGKTSIEIKKMEIAANAAVAPTEELRRKIIAAGQAWEATFRAQADADFRTNVLQPLRDELALLGLVGPQRELAALALEQQAFKAKAAKDGITDVNKAWEEYLRLRTEIVQGKSALEKDADAARVLNDQLRDMIGMLGSLGGFGQAIGGLLGLVTGNTRSIGGPVGDLLNIGIGTTTDKDGRVVARTIGDEIGKIFDQNGKFAKTFTSILQGAGTGMMAGNAFGLGKGTGGQLGSAIGGALGQELGEKFLSKGLESIAKGLGDFAGPLGSILGGVVGGLLGGMLTKVKWGRVDLSSAGVSGTAGNSGSSERAALAAGNSIFGSLQDIASQFGGSVGDFGNIAVGVRHGDYRVNTGGTSLKKKNGAVDFNDDAEAAIAYAIQQAIERGAIDGIRASTQALLKSSDDLQKNLQKALDFENVFKELASLRDPLGYALDELTREFDRLGEIFAEAGASAQEYADLEELLSLKRQEIIDDNAKKIIDELSDQNAMEVELLRLLGREEDALALSRLNELAATEAALQPMQAMIYQLQDARAVIDQFGPLAEDLKAFRQELLGDSGAGDSFAVLAAQFRETAELARMGDAGALGSLRGDAGAFLEAAKANASSQLDYRRAVGEVLAATDQGIFAAETQVDYAQLQIDAIDRLANQQQAFREELARYQQALIGQGEYVQRILRRVEGEGWLIRTNADTPVQVEVVS